MNTVKPARLAELAAVAVLLALAVVARLPNDPPALLWLDEAWRVRQALHGVVQGVLLPSEHLFAHLSFAVAGLDATAFRVWPLLGLLLAIVSAARLGTLLLQTPLWLWAGLTFAIAQSFLMHTREFKPYGMDLGLTFATMASAVAAVRSEPAGLRAFTIVSTITAAATAVFPFVHAGTSVFLLTRARFTARQLVASLGVPAVVFVLVYFTYLRGQTSVEATSEYWKALYLNSEANLRHIASHAWQTGSAYDLVGSAALWPCAFLVAPLFSLWRRDGWWALVLVPLLVHAAFSALGMYPLFDRPSFYLYGLAVFCVPYCADVLLCAIRNERWRSTAAWGVLAGGALWLAVSGRAEHHWNSGIAWPLQPDARLVFDVLRRDHEPTQPLYLNFGIADTFALYASEIFPEGSPLHSYPVDRRTVLQNRNMAKLCASLMVRSGDLAAGQTAWFASAHTGYAGRYYRELLRRVGNVDMLVDERAACLVRVTFTKPIGSLLPLCQQLSQGQ